MHGRRFLLLKGIKNCQNYKITPVPVLSPTVFFVPETWVWFSQRHSSDIFSFFFFRLALFALVACFFSKCMAGVFTGAGGGGDGSRENGSRGEGE